MSNVADPGRDLWSPGVEKHPRQYASAAVLAERLNKRDLIVTRTGEPEDNRLSVSISGLGVVAKVEWKVRTDDTGAPDQLWWHVNGAPVDEVDSPDATNRIVEAVQRAARRGCGR